MICSKCKKEKELSEFYKRKKYKSGYDSTCKVCQRKSNKKAVEEYRKKSPEKVSASNKKYREKTLNKNQIKWSLNNKEKVKELHKMFFQRNKEKINKTRRIYYKNNREKINKRSREYSAKKRKIDSLFKLKENIRSSIRMSFKSKSFKKDTNTSKILGCSFEQFKIYLESRFESWMNWDNYGLYNGELKYGWDIDHIIPISTAETKEDLIKLNHYTNLQPLCSKVNRVIKRGRV